MQTGAKLQHLDSFHLDISVFFIFPHFRSHPSFGFSDLTAQPPAYLISLPKIHFRIQLELGTRGW